MRRVVTTVEIIDLMGDKEVITAFECHWVAANEDEWLLDDVLPKADDETWSLLQRHTPEYTPKQKEKYQW